MKNSILVFVFVFTLLVGCQSETDNKESSSTKTEQVGAESEVETNNAMAPWTVNLNPETQAMEIRKIDNANSKALSQEQILDAINLKYPQTKLEWDRVSGNKAFVKIADASHLTQASGSLGARAYLAEVTFNLTELPGINAVSFSFEEGDHAAPGIYTRADFENLN